VTLRLVYDLRLALLRFTAILRCPMATTRRPLYGRAQG